MLGFGPGGAAFIAAMPTPDRRFDLLVLTGSSLDSIARQASPRSAAYEQAMRTRPLAVTEAIARAIYGQLFPSPPEKKGKTSHR
jgi:hypothetical protein